MSIKVFALCIVSVRVVVIAKVILVAPNLFNLFSKVRLVLDNKLHFENQTVAEQKFSFLKNDNRSVLMFRQSI